MLTSFKQTSFVAGKQVRSFAKVKKLFKSHPDRIFYSPMQAIHCVRNSYSSKVNESFDVVANLNIDPKKTNVIVRGILSLPHGNGKEKRIAAFADGKYATDAKEAGASVIGLDDLLADVKNGKIDFDVIVTAPRYLPKLSPVARILGPKKLMPSARAGTVSSDIAKAIRDVKRGNTEIKPDKMAGIHLSLGRMSFTDEQLYDNLKEFIIQLSAIKPPTAKNFVESVCVSSTQGPSFFLDAKFITPGRTFFNEGLANPEVPISEPVKRLSTRKRHALKNQESTMNLSQ